MLLKKDYKSDLLKALNFLPDEKIAQLTDFAAFLVLKYSGKPETEKSVSSEIDIHDFLMQQKESGRIWNEIDLNLYGIDKNRADDLRARLSTFTDEWDSPEMDIYNDYDAAKSCL